MLRGLRPVRARNRCEPRQRHHAHERSHQWTDERQHRMSNLDAGDPGSNGSDSWCNDMTTWMNQQIVTGQMNRRRSVPGPVPYRNRTVPAHCGAHHETVRLVPRTADMRRSRRGRSRHVGNASHGSTGAQTLVSDFWPKRFDIRTAMLVTRPPLLNVRATRKGAYDGEPDHEARRSQLNLVPYMLTPGPTGERRT